MKDTYRTISGESEGIFKDKGSKFLSFAYPVEFVEDTKEIIAGLKKQYHDARHHCYAYRIGNENDSYRMNDDGEPSGTAGKPIYGQILSNELTNILIVVVRYFGGTLLGTSGLINAYRNAATDAIGNAEIVTKTIEETLTLNFDYADINKVMRIFREEKLEQLNPVYDERCEISFKIRTSNTQRIKKRLETIPSLTVIKRITKNDNSN
jgi:uncharacterized YigZ family protein